MVTCRRLLLVGVAAVALSQVACTQNLLQGTYVLERRELADGTIVRPPEIAGCMTYSEKYRNFNASWKDAEGKPVSIAYLARYRLCERRYTEHSVYHVTNNWPAGTTTTHDLSQPAASSDVQKWGKRLEFDLPLYDEPRVEFCPCGFTARKDGEFTDYWARVR